MNNFNLYLENCLDYLPDSKVLSAMKYSFLSPGKRLRANIALKMTQIYQIENSAVFPAAAALEMIHAYSLIHDDLPAMDNDDLRRGKPSCHIEFDEATAILAGDGLLTEAFYLISISYPTDIASSLIKVLSQMAGAQGMILGQNLDIEAENKSISFAQLENIHLHKTGKLFAAAFMITAIIANKSNDLDFWHNIGIKLGLAFQVQDDILDVIKTDVELGKSTSDQQNNKLTTVDILGLDKAQDLANDLFSDVIMKITNNYSNTAELIDLINYIGKRNF